MAIEQYANFAQTTLTSGLDGSTDPITVPVASATNIPATGNFRLLIDSELFKVTAVAGTNLTASRAQEGSTIATHTNGATVSIVLTKQSVLNLLAEGITKGTYASLPAAGRAGRLYQATDNPFTYYDDGAAWNPRLAGVAMDLNPNLSDFATWVNQNSAAIDVTQGFQRLTTLTGQPDGTERLHLRVKAVGGLTSWSMTLITSFVLPPGSGCVGGIVLRESGSGKVMIYSPGLVSSQARWRADTWSSPTAYNANIFSDNVYFVGQPMLMRLTSDATKFYFKYSVNGGVTWLTHTTLTIAGSYLSGYDQVGFGIDNATQNNALQDFEMNVYHAVFG